MVNHGVAGHEQMLNPVSLRKVRNSRKSSLRYRRSIGVLAGELQLAQPFQRGQGSLPGPICSFRFGEGLESGDHRLNCFQAAHATGHFGLGLVLPGNPE